MQQFRLYAVGIIMLTLLTVVTVTAQPGGRQTPQQRADTLARELALTDAQKPQVLAVFAAQDSAMRSIFAEYQGDRDSTRSAMDKLRKATDAKMKTILTKDQYVKWEKTREMRRGGRRMER